MEVEWVSKDFRYGLQESTKRAGKMMAQIVKT